MDTPLIDQIRYLELRLAECEARPELHRHQIIAYRHQLALARGATSAVAYLEASQRTGTTMEVARAEWMDRYANWSCVYRALGDDGKYQAARRNYHAAAAVDADRFLAAVIAAKLESAPVHQHAEASQSALCNLLIALLDWAAEGSDSSRAEHAMTVQAFWGLMRQSDPLCTWQRICDYPPYRQRIPFAGERLDMIGEWLRQTVGAAQCDQPVAVEATGEAGDAAAAVASVDVAGVDVAGVAVDAVAGVAGVAGDAVDAVAGVASGVVLEIPTAAQAALPYHLAHGALDVAAADAAVMRELYERIFAIEARADSGPAFLRHMAEEGMYCRLAREPQIVLAERGLAHCRGHSQPHLEYHYQELVSALARCRSATEVDYEIERLGQYAAVEAAWNDIVLRYATKAIVSACGWQTDRSDDRCRTVVESQRLVCELFGRDWGAMLATPRIWDFVCKVLHPLGQVLIPPDNGSGLYWGEIGFAAVEGVREATVSRVMEHIQASFRDRVPTAEAVQEEVQNAAARPVFETAEALGEYITDLFRQATAGADMGGVSYAESRQELDMWGSRVHLNDLLDVIESPPRPPIAPGSDPT